MRGYAPENPIPKLDSFSRRIDRNSSGHRFYHREFKVLHETFLVFAVPSVESSVRKLYVPIKFQVPFLLSMHQNLLE
jgi:hypothetical protein